MTDRLSRDQRSRNMSKVKGWNTSPELAVRSALFRAGFRFRVQARSLAGRPDIILPRYRVVIFVHGCFWHGHACRRGRPPTSNVAFWSKKLASNIARDRSNRAQLRRLGWKVRLIWTCRLAKATQRLIRELERGRARTTASVRLN
jgi:DNA mismatch endonuclease (patch repair protein)